MHSSSSSSGKARRVALALVVSLLVAAGAAFGAYQWREHARDVREEAAVVSVRELVEAGRWAEARDRSLQQHAALGRIAQASRAAAWRLLDFRIAGNLRDLPRLVALAELDPALATTDEVAALWLYRTYEAAGMTEAAESLRATWRGRETSPASWLCADADRLIASNRVEEAKTLLSRRSFSGVEDVSRLLRLALVSADRGENVVRYLDEAYRLDPRNPDLRTMRGQVLERSGQAEYARMEFIAALAADPRNPLQRDQLGQFYLRQRNLPQAAQVYIENLGPEAPDFLWERAAFLARLLGRRGPDATALPPERRAGFAAWLSGLPATRLWDPAGYAALHLSPDDELNRPAAFWLGLVERFRTGDEATAGESIAQASRTATQMAATLHASLRLAVAGRGGARATEPGIKFPAPFENEHQFVQQMRAAAAGSATAAAAAEVARVLRSKNGIAACFLAEGWMAPAVALTDWDAALQAPEWLQFGLTRALREVRGVPEALAFADRLPAQPSTDYVRAELMLVGGREPEALVVLERLARGQGSISYSAAWLRSARLVELKRFDEALATIENCPALRSGVAAGELRARIALLRGDTAGADQQYRSLRDQSLEAGAYLARKAYAAGDWREARRITTAWLEKFPDNLQLRRNLIAIAERENKR